MRRIPTTTGLAVLGLGIVTAGWIHAGEPRLSAGTVPDCHYLPCNVVPVVSATPPVAGCFEWSGSPQADYDQGAGKCRCDRPQCVWQLHCTFQEYLTIDAGSHWICSPGGGASHGHLASYDFFVTHCGDSNAVVLEIHPDGDCTGAFVCSVVVGVDCLGCEVSSGSCR